MPTLEWGKIGPNSKSGSGKGGKGKFLSLKSGSNYQVRLLGNPAKFFKYLIQDPNGNWRSAITDDPEGSEVAKARNLTARERYAINIIDRTDGGIKILEAPISVFKEFEKYWEMTGKNPGGSNGGDFSIAVEGAGLKTRYTVKFLKRTPLSDAERVLITSGKLYDLEKEFAPQTEDEIKQKLFGDLKTAEVAVSKTGEAVLSEGNTNGNENETPPDTHDDVDDVLGTDSGSLDDTPVKNDMPF